MNKMRTDFPRCVIFSFLLLRALTAGADTALSFDEALRQTEERSPKLAAAAADVAAKNLQRDAVNGLGGPSLFLNTDAFRYRLHRDLDLEDAKRQAQNHASGIPNLPSVPMPPKLLPDDIELDHRGHLHSENLTVVWPLFQGGRIRGTKKLLAARADEARADAAANYDEVYVTLVQRYFGVQLARRVARVRSEAEQAIAAHDHMAERMWQEGLIAKAERLQAKVLFEDAKRQAENARSDEQLAAVALQRLLRQTEAVRPTTPVFISSHPLPPLSDFQDLALNHHPGLSKISAKKAEAQSLVQIEKARYLPSINVFGQSEIKGKSPSWAVGVHLNWTLWSGIDRRDMVAAARQQIRQAQFSDEEARDNILLLVEKNWLSLDQARRAYVALAANENLAEEALRLQKSSVREGLSTVPDLMTAQVRYAQTQTERFKAAYDYVQALSQLLAACGVPQQFQQYLQEADIRPDVPHNASRVSARKEKE